MPCERENYMYSKGSYSDAVEILSDCATRTSYHELDIARFTSS